MTCSVIIPAYNAEHTIMACLASVAPQAAAEAGAVIVVDSSADATPDLVRRHFPEVTLMHLPQRTDAGTARNLGIQQARGEVLCFLDSDCLAAPDWLQGLQRAQQDGHQAVGGAIANGNPDSLIGWAGYLAEFREYFPFQPRQFVPHVASCNVAYHRRIFERYGLFPTDWYPQEDLVFNQRLTQAGETILFDPAIRVAHINRTTVAAFLRHQYRIGRITAEVLKCFPALRGSRLARSRLLALCAAPLLPVVKFFNTLRVVRDAPDYQRRLRQAAPLLLAGLFCFWASGFVRGAFSPRRQ